MIYNYYFCNDITVENVNDLVERLQDREKIHLWVDTEGGNADAFRFLLSFLNSRKEDIEITLIGIICSMGTHLLTDFRSKININEGLDCILFHKLDRETYSLRKQVIDSSILIKQDKETNDIFVQKLRKLGLTEKQIKLYNSGKDVVLYKKDFHQLKLNQNELDM